MAGCPVAMIEQQPSNAGADGPHADESDLGFLHGKWSAHSVS
jgi:hypothetical protein